MRNWHRNLRLLAAAVVASALALGGIAYASSSRPLVIPAGTKDVLRETSSSVNLSTTGGQDVTILSFTLPAGAWVVSSEASLVNFGASDYTRCAIKAAGAQIASGTTMVGDPSLTGANGPAAYVAGRGLVGSVRSSTSILVSLVCSHDTSGHGPPYVDPGAVLWAHASASLNGLTH